MEGSVPPKPVDVDLEAPGQPQGSEVRALVAQRSSARDEEFDGRRRKHEGFRKALASWNENPANFHQATCVLLLGGKEALGFEERSAARGRRGVSGSFPRPENVSDMTNAEMERAWETADDDLSPNEVLVCHFSSMKSASETLGVNSPGFRASAVKGGCGGFFVCTVGPHELDWEQYQGGNFRERTGQVLWGKNSRQDVDKVEMVFFLKIPKPTYDRALAVPGGCELVRIIPPEDLHEQDECRWLRKENIVKSYVLLRNAPELHIDGEGPPPQSSTGLKWLFAGLSFLMVLFQSLGATAILFNTMEPSCQSNLQCTQPGTFCDSTALWGGRCFWCGYPHPLERSAAVHAYTSIKGPDSDLYTDSEFDNFLNATSFCANATHFLPEFCDDSTANDKSCAHPACRACPGTAEEPHPGWGVPHRLAISNTGRGNIGLHALDRWMENSTWGITSWHTTISGNVQTMQYSDEAMLLLVASVVSFGLANEVRDIMLCQITIYDRGGNEPWRPQDLWQWMLVVAWLLVLMVFFLNIAGVLDLLGDYYSFLAFGLHLTVVGPAIAAFIDARCGNSAWRIFLFFLNAVRRYAVVPQLAATVPIYVLYDSSNAKDMALNAVGALFILMVDNEAFAYGLPEHIRAHVEEYGRTEIGAREALVLNTAKAWTWRPLLTGMLLPVFATKYLHDPAEGWLRNPFLATWACLFCLTMVPGILGETLAAAEGGASASSKATSRFACQKPLAWLAMACWFGCFAMYCLKMGSGTEPALWALAALLFLFCVLPAALRHADKPLRHADKRERGRRLARFGASLGRWMVGMGAAFGALAFLLA